MALDIETRLAPLGYSVVTALSGEAAIERARELQPELILMDIRLGAGIDGIETVQRIREVLDVPVIYLTAYADESTLERARLTEPYGYILKPFDARELKASIEMALRKHRTDAHRHHQEELQRFLADAGARLAESLDPRTVIARAAKLLVPGYADWCLVYLKRTDDVTPALTLVHPCFENEMPAPAERADVIASVLRTTRAELHTDLDPSRCAALLGAHHDLMQRLGLSPCSLVCVPLTVRGRVRGAVLLVSARRYGPGDQDAAEDFAHRLGMALDNALLYRRAQRAVQMREEVLAVVSHDLRNALGTVLLQAQLLTETSPAPGLQTIISTTEHMTRLIGDLLDASAIDVGHLSLERRASSVDALVHAAITALQPVAARRSVALREALPAWRDDVQCDRDRIHQVLSNLIGNAIKFTPPGGEITVTADRIGAHIRFAVRDTGTGVAPDQLSQLFDRFSMRGPQRGLGLGLYIARGIVVAHGGTIWVESHLGRGTTFFFTLPVASPAEAHVSGP